MKLNNFLKKINDSIKEHKKNAHKRRQEKIEQLKSEIEIAKLKRQLKEEMPKPPKIKEFTFR